MTKVLGGGDWLSEADAAVAELLTYDDLTLPPNAFRYAWICDLEWVVVEGAPARLSNRLLSWDATQSPAHQQREVIGCVAEHWLRRRSVALAPPEMIEYVAARLMSPRPAAAALSGA